MLGNGGFLSSSLGSPPLFQVVRDLLHVRPDRYLSQVLNMLRSHATSVKDGTPMDGRERV